MRCSGSVAADIHDVLERVVDVLTTGTAAGLASETASGARVRVAADGLRERLVDERPRKLEANMVEQR